MKRRQRAIASTGRRAIAVAALLALGVLVPTQSAGAQVPAPVPFGAADFEASSTGTVVHADALQSGDTRLEDTEVAFSGASAAQSGMTPRRLNEMQREFQPGLGTEKKAYGRGSGLEIGLGVTPDDENQIIIAGEAKADAPPPTGPVTEQVGPLPADPLAYAALLRGQAEANWPEDGTTCPIGRDLSSGLGYAADAQLLDAGGDESEDDTLDEPVLAADAPDPERAVSQSKSRTTLVGQFNRQGDQIGQNFGVMAEVRETIAPVTFFRNTANEFTIEFLGEWVLQAVSTGIGGPGDGAYVHYGPGEASPETPILRVIQRNEEGVREATNIRTFQDFFDDEGLDITIPGLAEIVIGEDPRAIGGDATTSPTEAGDGTLASAAVDVVRVKLLEQVDEETDEVTFRAADLRVGHMEVESRVPAGGISCPLPVTKIASPEQVEISPEGGVEVAEDAVFTTTITVQNPYDCDLTSVRLVDDVWTTGGAAFNVSGARPPADQMPAGTESFSAGSEEDPATTLVWNDIGPIARGASASVSVDFTASDPGVIHDLATATASLGNCAGEDAAVAGVAIGVEQVSLVGQARANVAGTAVLGEQILPRTGPAALTTVLGGLGLLGLAGLGAALRRRLR